MFASSGPEQVEVIPGRLAWATQSLGAPIDRYDPPYSHSNGVAPVVGPFRVVSQQPYTIESDIEVCYQAFARDFGPVNLAVTTRFCRKLESHLAQKRGHVTYRTNQDEPLRRTNSAYLLGAYCILVEGMSAAEAWAPFAAANKKFYPYRDASTCPNSHNIFVLDCLEALEAATKLGWYDYATFDECAYEHFEKVENGDLNWVLPRRFLAFASPSQTAYDCDGYPCWTPEHYSRLFNKWNIKMVIRLNKPNVYNKNRFEQQGVAHRDLYFNDGSCPPMTLVEDFLRISEAETAGISIHCKAGLGRTGTLIGMYMMKHFKIPATVFIAWNRLCRPGSILGPQQKFLQDWEAEMFRRPSNYNRRLAIRTNRNEPMTVIDDGTRSQWDQLIYKQKQFYNMSPVKNSPSKKANMQQDMPMDISPPANKTPVKSSYNNNTLLSSSTPKTNKSGYTYAPTSEAEVKSQGDWLVNLKRTNMRSSS